MSRLEAEIRKKEEQINKLKGAGFKKNKLEVIVWKGLSISNEIKMIKRTYQGYSELLKLSVNPVFYVTESYIKLNMV